MNCSEFTRFSRVKRSGGEKEEERRRGSSISMHLNASRHAVERLFTWRQPFDLLSITSQVEARKREASREVLDARDDDVTAR